MAFSRVDDLDLNDTIFTHGERLPSFFLVCGGAALCYLPPMRPFLAWTALAMIGLAADYGPPAGTRMPPFQAPHQNGKMHALKDLLGPHGAAIVFFRSADW